MQSPCISSLFLSHHDVHHPLFLTLLLRTRFVLIVVGVMGNIAMIPFGGGMDASTGQFTGPSTMGTVVGAIVGTVQSMLSLILFSAFAGTAYARIRGADEGVDAASIANVFS